MPLAVVYWSIVSDRPKEKHKIVPLYIVFKSLGETMKDMKIMNDYESYESLWKVMKVMKALWNFKTCLKQ